MKEGSELLPAGRGVQCRGSWRSQRAVNSPSLDKRWSPPVWTCWHCPAVVCSRGNAPPWLMSLNGKQCVWHINATIHVTGGWIFNHCKVFVLFCRRKGLFVINWGQILHLCPLPHVAVYMAAKAAASRLIPSVHGYVNRMEIFPEDYFKPIIWHVVDPGQLMLTYSCLLTSIQNKL